MKYNKILLLILSILLAYAFLGCNRNITPYEEEIHILQDNLKANIYLFGEEIIFDYPLIHEKISTLSEVNLLEDTYTVIIINVHSETLTSNEIDVIDELFNNGNVIIAFFHIEKYYNSIMGSSFMLGKDFSNEAIVVGKMIDQEIHFGTLDSDENQTESGLELMLLKMINNSIEYSYD